MKIIGHRGAKGLAPENTLNAISHALKHHVDEVELDVRVTQDGVPILSHDPAIHMEIDSMSIKNTSFAALRKHKPDLASLDDALSLIEARCIVHMEIKPHEPIEPIVTVVKNWLDSEVYQEQNLLLASKSQKTLLALQEALPSIPKAVIESWSGTRAVLRARKIGTKRLSMNRFCLWVGFLRPMQKRGYQISAYTLNDPAQVKKWQPYLYGVITDYPDLFEQ